MIWLLLLTLLTTGCGLLVVAGIGGWLTPRDEVANLLRPERKYGCSLCGGTFPDATSALNHPHTPGHIRRAMERAS